MGTVEVAEAAARLPELLGRVANGERVSLTDGGRPVAVLGPPDPPLSQAEGKTVQEVVREMLRWRDEHGPTLGREEGVSLRDIAHEGHKY